MFCFSPKFTSHKFLLITLLFISQLFLNCSQNDRTANLVFINGNIITVDSINSVAEAIAISKDTIMAIGNSEQIRKFVNDSTTVIDLKGKTAIPGFIDSHAHLIGTGKTQINLNLREAKIGMK